MRTLKEEIKAILYRNLKWQPKGNFPYMDEESLKEIRIRTLKEINQEFERR